jgi:hypothetical protein
VSARLLCGRDVGDAIVCGREVRRYRQCPLKSCCYEIARCDEHGGDVRAVALMIDHIALHVRTGELAPPQSEVPVASKP